MAGLVGVGTQTRQRAISGLQEAGQMYSQREQAGEAIKTAEHNQKTGLVTSGAATGAAIGASMIAPGAIAGSTTLASGLAAAGPIGWGIGAGIVGGYLLSEIF